MLKAYVCILWFEKLEIKIKNLKQDSIVLAQNLSDTFFKIRTLENIHICKVEKCILKP